MWLNNIKISFRILLRKNQLPFVNFFACSCCFILFFFLLSYIFNPSFSHLYTHICLIHARFCMIFVVVVVAIVLFYLLCFCFVLLCSVLCVILTCAKELLFYVTVICFLSVVVIIVIVTSKVFCCCLSRVPKESAKLGKL